MEEKTPATAPRKGKVPHLGFSGKLAVAGRRKVVKRRGFGRWSSDPAVSCSRASQNIMVMHWAGTPRTETSFKPRLSFLTRGKTQ